MACEKKAVERKGGDKAKAQRIAQIPEDARARSAGIAGDGIEEPIPNLIQTPSEKVYKGTNNTWLVFGRDRPRSRLSGYGGKGDTQAASIDIVAGRMGSEAASFIEEVGIDEHPAGHFHSRIVRPNLNRMWVDPDMVKDAARIYISQKTDIDDNLGLVDGRVGNSKTKSGIAIKADGIRIIAREGIKLVTRTDRKNSQGCDIQEALGIDLIATNNDEDLQPLVKGDNLAEALQKIATHVDKLNGIVDSLLMYQISFNEALTHHTHFGPGKIISPIGPGFYWETTPSMPVVSRGIKTMSDHLSQTKRSLMIHKVNLGTFKFLYLNPAGGKYINSRYNNTT